MFVFELRSLHLKPAGLKDIEKRVNKISPNGFKIARLRVLYYNFVFCIQKTNENCFDF